MEGEFAPEPSLGLFHPDATLILLDDAVGAGISGLTNGLTGIRENRRSPLLKAVRRPMLKELWAQLFHRY